MKRLIPVIIFPFILSPSFSQRSIVFKTEQELKTWLNSKLIWDPDINIDIKKNNFLNVYFEGAAPYIKNIIDTIAYTLKKSRNQFVLYNRPYAHRDDYLSPSLIKYYYEQIGIGVVETLKNSKALKRVDKFAQTFRYADIEIAKAMINTDDWIFEKANDTTLVLKTYYDSLLTELTDKSRIFGLPVLYDGITSADDYSVKTRNYFNTAIENHLAVGARISFKERYDAKYKANGPQSLIDGIHGFETTEVLWQGWLGKDLVATIDLGSSKQVHSMKMNFINDPKNKIFDPISLIIEISNDGKNFIESGKAINPNAETKSEKQIVPLQVNLAFDTKARYIRVTAKNFSKLPGKEVWLLTDEIVVK